MMRRYVVPQRALGWPVMVRGVGWRFDCIDSDNGTIEWVYDVDQAISFIASRLKRLIEEAYGPVEE